MGKAQMSDNSSTFTRRELYDRVWTDPVAKLAEEFGLSDRGLAKICERNGIPVPPRAYWAKKVAGKRVVRPPLIEIEGKEFTGITISPQRKPVTSEPQGDTKPATVNPYKELMDRELKDIRPIAVAETLKKPHPIVAGWIEQDRRDHERWRSLGYGLSTRETRSQSVLSKRRLRILSSLFKALEARQFVLVQDRTVRTGVSVRFERESIKFDLSERVRQQRRKLTEQERKERGTTQQWTQTREATGELVLKMTSGMPCGLSDSWKDDADGLLERKLHFVVVGFIVAARTNGTGVSCSKKRKPRDGGPNRKLGSAKRNGRQNWRVVRHYVLRRARGGCLGKSEPTWALLFMLSRLDA